MDSITPIYLLQNNTELKERVSKLALPQIRTFPGKKYIFRIEERRSKLSLIYSDNIRWIPSTSKVIPSAGIARR